jgi:hypothetical protein
LAPARAEEAWDACIAAPTRACVLDLAAREIASVDNQVDRASMRVNLGLARFKAGLASDADRDFAKAAEELQNEDNLKTGYGPRPSAIAGLASALAQMGHIDEAIRTADQITIDDGSAARALAAIAAAEAKAGRAAEAAQTSARALERALAMKYSYGKSGVLRAVSSGQRASGLVADAQRTMALARDAALAETDALARDINLASIANDETEAGDISSALQTAALIGDSSQRDAATQNILRATLAAGKFDQAAPIPPTLSGMARVLAFDQLAAALEKAGRKAEAAEALASARQTVNGLSDGLQKASGLLDMAGAESDLGGADAASADRGSATAILDSLLASAGSPAAQPLPLVLAKAGRTKEALALAGAMSPGFQRDAAYMTLYYDQAKSGDFSGALTSLRQMTMLLMRVSSLERMAQAIEK